MANVIIPDASPIIYLARAHLLDLLRVVEPRVLIPAAVAEEIRQRAPDDPAVAALAGISWLHHAEPPALPESITVRGLGRGEAAVLATTLATPQSVALLDDLLARRQAIQLGIAFRGTMGLVLLAKRRGTVQQARPILARLREAGM